MSPESFLIVSIAELLAILRDIVVGEGKENGAWFAHKFGHFARQRQRDSMPESDFNNVKTLIWFLSCLVLAWSRSKHAPIRGTEGAERG